jgi:hypothetical protein
MSGLGVPCGKGGKYRGRSIACVDAHRRWEVQNGLTGGISFRPRGTRFSLALGVKRQPVLRIHTMELPK